MARAVISSHTWNEIKKDFESGMSQADIRKKHGVKTGALGNKIKRDGWRLSQEQRTAMSEFQEASVKMSESFHNANTIQKKEMEDEFTTILEDNDLIQNNRKLLKMAQGVLVKNKDKFDHTNVKNLTGAIKDIESVANPQASRADVIVNNQVTHNILTIDDLYGDS